MFIDPRAGANDRPFGTRIDFDGDGHLDVVAGVGCDDETAGAATVYLGAAAVSLSAPSMRIPNPEGATGRSFASHLAYAGDVNGDGFGDLLVGAPSSMLVGRVYLYVGSTAGLQTSPLSTLTGSTI
jgi:hypothetical protein